MTSSRATISGSRAASVPDSLAGCSGTSPVSLPEGGLALVLGEEVEIDGGQVDLVVELLAADHRSQVAQVDGQLLQRWVLVVDDLGEEVVLADEGADVLAEQL